MASRAKPETRLAIIVSLPAGDRAYYTLPVGIDTEAVAERAERIRARLADKTGCPVRVDAFTHTVSA